VIPVAGIPLAWQIVITLSALAGIVILLAGVGRGGRGHRGGRPLRP
jgi:hypothetical protein